MNFKIDEMWQSDSLLYSYIDKRIMNNSNITNFKNNYLSAVKNKDETRLIEILEGFKENVSEYVVKFDEQIDFNFFNELILNIETFYKKSIKGEFHYFRYYQYLSFLYTYIFFSLKDKTDFKYDLLDYIKTSNIIKNQSGFNIDDYLDNEFKRLGYWMATGSGKTLIMYGIIYMYMKFQQEKNGKKIKDLYIIVPSNELRRQHKEFLTGFGTSVLGNIIDNGTIIDFDNVRLFGDYEVSGKLTTIQGISNEKLGDNSVLLIDEAHKGAGLDNKSETGLESLKSRYINGKDNFMFEFSATFQKAFEKEFQDDTNIFNTYILSSIYKYNLYNFNVDGFGKNYFIETGSQQEDSDKKILILNSLINYYIQLEEYDKKEQLADKTDYSYRKYGAYLDNKGERIYKPLYVGLSYKLDSASKDSEDSLKDIIKNIISIFQNLEEFDEELTNKNISVKKFYEIFTKFKYEQGKKPNISIYYDKSNDEIRIYLENNIMLINTGQNKKISEVLIEDEDLKLYATNKIFQDERLFSKIDSNENILFLFGSRKFVEGWDSKRPSTILLFKMGKTGTIISTQILGRGIRLFGFKGDGFRRLGKINNNQSNPLESINIFGYDIDEFKNFIESISEELYKVAVIKKRQYSKEFKQYLEEKNIGESDGEIESVFSKYFKLINSKLNQNKKVFEDIKILDVSLNDSNKLIFSYEGEEVSKLEPKYNDYMTLEKGTLVEGKGRFEGERPLTSYYSIGEVFNDNSLNIILINYFENISKFKVANNDFELFFKYIKNINIETDRFLHGFENYFILDKQEKKVKYFINKLYDILNRVSNKLINKETIGAEYNVGNLKLDNLIDTITLNFQLNKNNQDDKDLIKLFFGDSSKFMVERDFEELTNEQKEVVNNYFIQNKKDPHIYDRLYYLGKKDMVDLNNIHTINSELPLKEYDISPSELKLNINEENKVVKILKKIKENNLESDYDIFYLRNIRGKEGNFLWYENIQAKYSKFYPDFIFWFINKQDKEDITVVYYEPKGESIDKNDTYKKELFENEINSGEINSSILSLFGFIAWQGDDNKFGNIKFLGVVEKEDR